MIKLFRRNILAVVMSLFYSIPTCMAEDSALNEIFSKSGTLGTIVIEKVDGSTQYVHNTDRASERFTIASTFKILHSFIAISEGVTDANKPHFKWDGKKRWLESWNQNHSLRSAYASSCVWCYQQIARELGEASYSKYLKSAGFKELSEKFNLTEFWLNGELSVSALEQVAFLKKFINRTIGGTSTAYMQLKEIMLHETTPGYRMYAKTGWGIRPPPEIGWFVGYLESGNDTWAFATNIQTNGKQDLPRRKEITLASLKAKGIIR